MVVAFLKTDRAPFAELLASARERHFDATRGSELDDWATGQLVTIRKAMKAQHVDAAIAYQVRAFAVHSRASPQTLLIHTYAPRGEKIIQLGSPGLRPMFSNYERGSIVFPRDEMTRLSLEIQNSLPSIKEVAAQLLRGRGLSDSEVSAWRKKTENPEGWRAGTMDPANEAFSIKDELEHTMATGAFLTILSRLAEEAKARKVDILLMRLDCVDLCLYDFESLKKVIGSRDESATKKAVETAVARERQVAREAAAAEIDEMAAASVLVGATAEKDKVELYDREAVLGDYLVPLLGWRLEMAPGRGVGQHVELTGPGIEGLEAALSSISKGTLEEKALKATDAPPGGSEGVRAALLAFGRNKAMKKELAAIQNLAERARREDGKIVVAFLA